MTGTSMPNDPAAIVAALESRSTRIETPCGAGVMVWRVWGEDRDGNPPLVLFHGGSGSWKHWLRNIDRFAQSRRVVAADMPGLGDSADLPGPASFAALGDVMGAGLDAVLGAGVRYDMMGFSLGSFVAPWAIRAAKAKARSLTLIHGHFAGRMLYSPQGSLRRWRGIEDAAARDAILRNNLGALMLANPGAADELTLHVYRHDLDLSRLRVSAFIDTLDTSILRDLDVALFAISGDRDPTATPDAESQHSALHALRPDAKSWIVPGGGHWLMWESPGAFHALADEILAAAAGL